MIRLSGAAFLTLVYVFCLGAKDVVHGTPMYRGNSESPPRSPPKFGEVDPYHLLKPEVPPYHQDDYHNEWSGYPHQGYQYQYHDNQDYQHQQYPHQDHLGHSQETSWNHDDHSAIHYGNNPISSPSQFHYHDNQVDPQQYYNADHLTDAFASGMHFGHHDYPTDSYDSYGNMHNYGGHLGQGSTSYSSAPASPVHHHQKSPTKETTFDHIPALASLHHSEAAHLVRRLKYLWNTDREKVEERLGQLTEEELSPYVLQLSYQEHDDISAWHTAEELKQLLINKSLREQKHV